MTFIKKRRDYLALRNARRTGAPSFLMLAKPNPDNGDSLRLGFTVTKKLGGAVIRNRIKRRLKAAAREVFPLHGTQGTDYVLIARKAAFDRNYTELLDDMKRALLSQRRDTK